MKVAREVIEQALNLGAGEHLDLVGYWSYRIHRYDDGWLVFWHVPTSIDLGRFIRDPQDLVDFMCGDGRRGVQLRGGINL